MYRRLRKMMVLLLAAAAAAAVPTGAALARSSSASVGITIRVLPNADIDFPKGFDFILDVPGRAGPGGRFIKPVAIPFKVTGSAVASVSIKPDTFIQISDGKYLGAAVGLGGDGHKNRRGRGHTVGKGKGHATGSDDVLGYDMIVQFPLRSWLSAFHPSGNEPASFWSSFGKLPGGEGAGTPPLSADIGPKPVYGMVYVFARKNWTADGGDVSPGDYAGTVEALFTVHEK